MFKTLANVFRIPDLRKKILITLLILTLYRLGSFIPIPGVSGTELKSFFARQTGSIFDLLNLFVGGNFERASIFALGIMPYITASIVIQLLGSIVPYFEKLRKEGADGQKKLNQITRYCTVALAAFNAITVTVGLVNMHGATGPVVPQPNFLFHLTGVITLVTGTMIVMWLGEQITEYGIGNGISLIIFAGIIARYPEGFINLFRTRFNSVSGVITSLLAIAVMILATAAIIFVTEAVRKIPVQYAKRIVGRKVYGGQSTYIPLRVNTAGVIPIIFAQSILMFPATLITLFQGGEAEVGSFWYNMRIWFSPGHWVYTIIYVALIIFFAYFYTAIVLNPTEMAENMIKYGGHIPGKKPGKKTAEYISSVLTRITLPGAVFFALIALLPEIMTNVFKLPFYFGGTGLIIVVGVALDTLKQIESHLIMRHYDGFMKKGKLKGRTS
ncbi:MAG TPA: preprotein translocase subunit SecY [Candidatus Syntrophosphaera thermopropionivorans]|uniref:Preprotein translocase subunit SecY n=1 Tax=Candidatus Syntrophosphaera thermopropionivorans TaxID=2593015 RepID=A0AC61QI46_9BACT|nr:preprotein translocase subunit SecY [Candidatus Syntrophosphaera thermopropionivorans]MBP7899171.1 preprotein translocase subunit SecY [Candidatus Syntrophosphaera sp.]MBP9006302.1 preprotein translocase subunit SecY [Candidatus Syntrophosphaera sp.]TDF72641.1 preprotein translocase subunit SecY [Candidatus Syntrophosphaera thermopropionivorans]HOH82867.1 preprotein translocase subunit SecY [Candidatus Syntrophosphaera thermopropionivorans]HOJ41922.1 preprotein translocase subunit SecY [Can